MIGIVVKACLPFPDFRLKMKPDVVLRRLAIAVASNDHSYMPQLVSVAVGKNRRSLEEIKDIRIPSNVTGYVSLLENVDITYPCEYPVLNQLGYMCYWTSNGFGVAKIFIIILKS